jgi:hypothetical protein
MATPKYALALQQARNDEITGSSKINNLRVGFIATSMPVKLQRFQDENICSMRLAANTVRHNCRALRR